MRRGKQANPGTGLRELFTSVQSGKSASTPQNPEGYFLLG
jgi:hypothetical protein